jgi:hypothetical protein
MDARFGRECRRRIAFDDFGHRQWRLPRPVAPDSSAGEEPPVVSELQHHELLAQAAY